jgi:hypothetical protein
MSTIDVFSLRYRARVGSRQFDRELYLHDYSSLETEYRRLEEAAGSLSALHGREEQRLREQAWRAVESANGRHVARDLLRKARERLSDVYGQARRIHPRDLHRFATLIVEQDVAWLFDRATNAEQTGPKRPSRLDSAAAEDAEVGRFDLACNVVVFDYIEAFFELLPSDEQLEFSRDLNHRLNTSGSPWFFQLGRWRRDDWPRERDGQFDMILFSLRERMEEERRRELNRVMKADVSSSGEDDVYAEIQDRVDDVEERSHETSKAVGLAAELLFNADRLLNSDLLSPSVRHEAAVGEARAALDLCLTHFSGAAYGPFVDVERAKDERRANLLGFRAEKPRATVSEQRLKSHEAAAVRIRQIGHALAEGGRGLKAEERKRLLLRAPLAEFMLRLALFGVETRVEETDEDLDGRNDVKVEIKKEVAAYSYAAQGDHSLPLSAKGFTHHAPAVKLPLNLKKPETARLAVETLAKLCLYATGARVVDEFAQPGSFDPMTGPSHPRAGDMDRQRRRLQMLAWFGALIGVALSLGSAFLLGALVGPGVIGGL